MNFDEINWFMSEARSQADEAYRIGEVPVGAIIVSGDGRILSRAHNDKERGNDPCAHAEVLAIRQAAKELKEWRLLDCSLVVTLEPCPMCLSAMIQARIKRLIFGAYDSKGGALSLGYNFYKDKRLNHQFDVVGGVLHFECSKLLSDFFRERRQSYRGGKS